MIEVHLVGLQAADISRASVLSRPELERLDTVVGEADRGRFLLGAVVLRTLVAARLGIEPAEVPVDRTCTTCGGWHGQPTIPGSDLHVSVAHSGTVVAVAVASTYRIGIDVERIGSRPVGQVWRWANEEARLKAGGDHLAEYVISPPIAGYVSILSSDAPVAQILGTTVRTPTIGATDPRRLQPARFIDRGAGRSTALRIGTRVRQPGRPATG